MRRHPKFEFSSFYNISCLIQTIQKRPFFNLLIIRFTCPNSLSASTAHIDLPFVISKQTFSSTALPVEFADMHRCDVHRLNYSSIYSITTKGTPKDFWFLPRSFPNFIVFLYVGITSSLLFSCSMVSNC